MAIKNKNAVSPKAAVKQLEVPVVSELNEQDVFLPEEELSVSVEPEIQLQGQTAAVKENEFMDRVLSESNKPRVPGKWVSMTAEEVQHYQREKRLIGYDPVRKQGLLKG